MNHLEDGKRPESDDPHFWATWTGSGESTCTVNWGMVADSWQEKAGTSGAEQIRRLDWEPEEEGEDDDLPF